MAYKGKFSPRNPQKYRGDYRNIVYRSSWECRAMSRLDSSPDVLEWSSEEIVIPYKSPVDGRWHRYFPDFLVKMRSIDGKVETVMIEVKPEKQSQPPKIQKRKTKQYIQEVVTWSVNNAKWKAAIEYCKDRKWKFVVMASTDGIKYKYLTENDLLLS